MPVDYRWYISGAALSILAGKEGYAAGRGNRLVRKAKEGDTAAFAVMIRRYQNRFARRSGSEGPGSCGDVAQEAFVTAFQS